ncbi:hypothetical protein BDA99DRAFT_537707 [Phascolomyces articulosus]|uniref:Uncharacterized protein n=1 Tax=Phascolomyces articulosus TaxID=60185 RepID=A0AAD5K008_9FUNG|nr:hypothetical protein BDA99DRAFT_537707 [Phascolomyces articulosus]
MTQQNENSNPQGDGPMDDVVNRLQNIQLESLSSLPNNSPDQKEPTAERDQRIMNMIHDLQETYNKVQSIRTEHQQRLHQHHETMSDVMECLEKILDNYNCSLTGTPIEEEHFINELDQLASAFKSKMDMLLDNASFNNYIEFEFYKVIQKIVQILQSNKNVHNH